MPTKREREYYRMGFRDGRNEEVEASNVRAGRRYEAEQALDLAISRAPRRIQPKRKLSPWNKFVKANSKKPRFRYKSGAKRGKVNLKALGVAYRKKKRR